MQTSILTLNVDGSNRLPEVKNMDDLCKKTLKLALDNNSSIVVVSESVATLYKYFAKEGWEVKYIHDSANSSNIFIATDPNKWEFEREGTSSMSHISEILKSKNEPGEDSYSFLINGLRFAKKKEKKKP